ncbi:MAG: MinD/ParA family protein [Methanosarcinaceae archaeon]|nr:MinD/ParA family protein [Methanosarcinaceae archaeon]
MVITIAVHSCKGGTGKTSIALNLAGAYAASGKNVCLIDLDSKAPSLSSIFNTRSNKWVNDVLFGKCNITDVIHDVSDGIGVSGKLYVGLSDPNIIAIRDISSKDRKWQAKALQVIMDAKKDLINAGMDVIIFDTGPGVDFSSINAVATADYVLVIVKPNKMCIIGTGQIINGVYKLLGKNCGVVENMCHETHFLNPISNTQFGVPVLASIPCMCDVQLKTDADILALNEPNHPFSESIFKIMGQISEQSD